MKISLLLGGLSLSIEYLSHVSCESPSRKLQAPMCIESVSRAPPPHRWAIMRSLGDFLVAWLNNQLKNDNSITKILSHVSEYFRRGTFWYLLFTTDERIYSITTFIWWCIGLGTNKQWVLFYTVVKIIITITSLISPTNLLITMTS